MSTSTSNMLTLLFALSTLLCLEAVASATGFSRVIVHEVKDNFAARELARYVYVATGAFPKTLALQSKQDENGFVNGLAGHSEVIALARSESRLLKALTAKISVSPHMNLPNKKGAHVITNNRVMGKFGNIDSLTTITGVDNTALLYGVYSTVEQLGIRFELHGDILPDPTAEGGLPLKQHAITSLPLTSSNPAAATPQFDYRGLQPFHDFPEGPDWWDTDYYKLINSQLAKMKMNFLGLHTYPYKPGTPGTGSDEPTVWVGPKEGLDANGSVLPAYAYPTSYANTFRNEWGYAALATSDYSWGTANIFETDCWGTYPTTADSCPSPKTPEAAASMFERTTDMLEAAFAWGKTIGVESCVGTETPLSYPGPPPPPTPPLPKCTVGPSTCYQDDVARILPHTVTISSPDNDLEWCASECAVLNYTLAGVEYAVACFCGNSINATKVPQASCDAMKCAGNAEETCGGNYIMKVYGFKCTPQFEDTPNVTVTQEVYEGIFTRLLKKMPSLTWYWVWTPEGWEWGKMNSNNPIFTNAIADLGAAMSARDAVNPGLKMATNGWVVGPLPDRSIFDKVLPTTWDAITSIDMDTGHNPVDPSYNNVTRHPKWVIPWMEDDPDLSAPQLWVNRTLEHMQDAKLFGCSGLLGIHWRTRATGPQISAMAQKSWAATLTSHEFWVDWAQVQFGVDSAVAMQIAAVFDSIDSFKMPLVVSWSGGPGTISAHCSNQNAFAFVDTLSALTSQIDGELNQARFAYWTATFTYMRAISDFSCSYVQFNTAFAAAKSATGAARTHILQTQTIPARIQMVSNATKMISNLQLTLSNPGELGTYMNVESRSLIAALTNTGAALQALMGLPLPSNAMPPKTYGASARIIVPTIRTALAKGETLNLRALILSSANCSSVTMNVKPMSGGGSFVKTMFTNIGRSVFTLALPAQTQDFEYYINAQCGQETPVFPPGAPTITQTVVLQ